MNQYEYQKFIEMVQKSTSAIKISGDEIRIGHKTFGSGDIESALDYIKKFGISTQAFYSPGDPVHANMVGAQYIGDLERLSRESGLNIEFLTHNAKATNLASFTEEFIGKAFIRGGKEVIATIRAFDGDRMLSRDELMSTFEDKLGRIYSGTSAATGKRISAHTTMRSTQGMFDRNLNTLIFDHRRMAFGGTVGPLNAREAQVAADGMSILNPRTLREIAKGIEGRAKTTTDTQTRKALLNEARKARKVASDGGIYNIRAEGLNLIDLLSGDPILDRLGGQIKGNALVPAQEFFDQTYGRGIDIVTSFINLKSESVTLPGKSKGNITLDARHAGSSVTMNIQAALANPDLFVLEDLREATNRKVNRYFEAIRRDGRLSDGAIAHFRRELAGDFKYEDVYELKRRMSFAQEVIDWTDSGADLMQNPRLLQSITSSFRESLMKPGKPTIPNFVVPDALGGYIYTDAMARMAGIDTELWDGLEDGKVSYDSTYGWKVKAKDLTKHFHDWGGPDQDDRIEWLIRWDDEADDLKAIGIRPPTGRGEIAVLGINAQDAAVETVMRERLGDDAVDSLIADPIAWRQAVKENIVHIDSGAEIAKRSISSGHQLFGMPMGDFPTLESEAKALQDAIDEQFDLTEQKLRKTIASGGGYTAEVELKLLKEFEESRFALEEYMNTRMIQEDFVRLNEGKLKELLDNGLISNREFELFRQEGVIDMMTKGQEAEGLNVAYVRKTTHDRRELMGRLMAEHDMEMSRALYKEKLPGANGVLAAYQRAAGEDAVIDDRLTDDDYWSKLTKDWEGGLDRVDTRRNTLIRQEARIPDYIENLLFTTGAEDDIRGLTLAVDIAKQKWDEGGHYSDELIRKLEDAGIDPDLDNARRQFVSDSLARSLADLFEEDGTMGARAKTALAGYIQKYGNQPGEMIQYIRGGLTFAETATYASFSPTIGLSEDQAKIVSDLASRPVTRDMLINPNSGDLGVEEAVRAAMNESRASTQSAEGAEKIHKVARNVWEDFSIRGAKDFVNEVPSLKKAGVAAALIVAGSFMYQGFKGDRTPEDLQGTPLLPGGSAYESDYYKGELPPGLGNANSYSQDSGMTYRVNVRGEDSEGDLFTLLEEITGASATGSTYPVPNPNFR